MNPRQRRGVLFIVLAGLGSIALFFVVTSYVAGVNSQVGPRITVYTAAEDIAAYAEVTPELVEAVEVPLRYVPEQAVRDLSDLVGQRMSYNVAPGTMLGTDMLLPVSALDEDEREIAIQVDAVTGIAGRLASGDLVDVYAVFAGEGSGSSGGVSQVLVRSVRVVSVGGVATASQQLGQGALEERNVVPVTLALTPEDALRVTYADAFAHTLRLVGLPPGIDGEDRGREPSVVDARTLGLPQPGEESR